MHHILWSDALPIHRYDTLFSGGDPFHISVVWLGDAVTRGHVCTAESQSDSPIVQEILKQAAAEGGVVIRQNYNWWAPRTKLLSIG